MRLKYQRAASLKTEKSRWFAVVMIFIMVFILSAQQSSAQQLKAFERPAISGDQIVLYSASNEVVAAIPLQGKKVDVITDWSNRYVLYKTLTGDGFPNGILRVYDIQTGESRELSGYYIISASLSPDNQKIAAVTWEPAFGAIYLFDLQTLNSTQLVEASVREYSANWNTKSDKIVYVVQHECQDVETDQEIATDIEYIELNNRKRIQITNNGIADFPRWQNEQDILFRENGIYKLYQTSSQITTQYAEVVSGLPMKFIPGLGENPPVFKLPYTSGESWLIGQAYCPKDQWGNKTPSHCSPLSEVYAIDFVLCSGCGWGKAVRAIAGGKAKTVIESKSGGYGNLVTIDHGGTGYISYYGHNSAFVVTNGTEVLQGQEIAKVGNTGYVKSTKPACPNYPGTHIHFEVRYKGQAHKPEPLDGYTSNCTTTPCIKTGQCLISHNDGSGDSGSCACDGTNPVLSCIITGDYSCTGRDSITLSPGFYAQQGSTVTLHP